MTSHIGILSTGRHDWAILRPLAEALAAAREPGAPLSVLRVGAAAILPPAWYTGPWRRPCAVPVDASRPRDEQLALAAARAGALLDGIERLILLGDRVETAGVALAAVARGIPIAHLHGGESTAGSIDDTWRDVITACSDLHLVAHEDYAARIRARPGQVVEIVGAMGAEAMLAEDDAPSPYPYPGHEYALVCVHPETRPVGGIPTRLATERVVECVMLAVDTHGLAALVLDPGPDDGVDGAIHAALERWCDNRDLLTYRVSALLPVDYRAAMRHASVCVGNSSSFVIESPVLGVPVVLVGDRQTGRPHRAHEARTPVETIQGVGLALADERVPDPDWLHARGATERAVQIVLRWAA